MRKIQFSYWYNLKQECSTAEAWQHINTTERSIYRQTPGKLFYAYAVVKAQDAEKTDHLVWSLETFMELNYSIVI